MANVVVVGAQWGDEGKGKIVDWLSERADVIARFQGGHNAGHTLVIDGKVYKLNALPSGVVRGGKLSVIGNGVVLDPVASGAGDRGHSRAGRCHHARDADGGREHALILPIHGELGPRPRGGGLQGHQDRHHRARHRPRLRGQGGPPRGAGGRSGRRGDANRAGGPGASASRPAAPGPGNRGGGPRGADRATDGDRAADPALCRAGLEGAGRAAPRGQAHPLRGGAGGAARY